MKQFEVDYVTTLPPWQFGHEKIEAEELTIAKDVFRNKHGMHAKIFKIQEKSVVSERRDDGAS